MKKTIICIIVAACILITGCSHRSKLNVVVEQNDSQDTLVESSETTDETPQAKEQEGQPYEEGKDVVLDIDLTEEVKKIEKYEQLIVAYHKNLVEREEVPPLQICKSIPFDEGALVMAEFMYDGETSPELYYIVDNDIVCATVYSYTWGYNYTLFKDKTILFGPQSLLFCELPSYSQGVPETYKINVEFENETVSSECDEQGYILIKDGYHRPISYRTETLSGKTVGILDISKETQTKIFEELEDTTLNYCPMTTLEPYKSTCSIEINGEPVFFHLGLVNKEDPLLSMWALWMDHVDFSAEVYEPSVPFKVSGNQEVYDYFWLDLSNATADSSLSDLIMQTGHETPDQSGTYMLVLKTDLGYYVKSFEISE